MKKSSIFLVLGALLIISVSLYFIKDKNLNPNDELVTDLYGYLGNIDINKCGGLITYGNGKVTLSNLDVENRLCMAYYNLEESKMVNETNDNLKTNDNNEKICEIGENLKFLANDDSKTCAYTKIKAEDLKEAYKKVYGEDLKEKADSFSIASAKSCLKEGEEYYCGMPEVYSLTLAPDASIYRVIKNAVKTLNGQVIINDYFLKISGNKCFVKNDTETSDEECTKYLKDNKINTSDDEAMLDLIKKYGSVYKHTFNKNKDDSYYWKKSELK